MTSRIPVVQPGAAADERVNELLRESEEEWYEDAAFFGAMAHVGELFERTVALLKGFSERSELEPELLELVRLRIARTHQCAYCATVRTAEVREDVSEREQAVLGDDVDEAALTDRELLAVRLAEFVSEDPHRITDEFFEQVREEFGDGPLVELLLFVSLETGLDRFCIALQLDTTEQSPYPTGLEYPFSPD